MKHIKHSVAALAGAISLALAASASALPTLTTPDGVVDPFGGFEWNQAGSAMVTGVIADGANITTEFMANAVAVNFVGGAIAATPNLYPTNPAGTYEYTVYATITETVSCPGGDCSTSALFTATGGQYYIFFDTTADSNLVTGAGVTDGELLIQGNILSGAGTFALAGAGGIGSFAFQGDVNFVNSTYLTDLDTSTAAATLQFGNFTTNWTQPTSFATLGGGTQAIDGRLLLQADANQTFTARLPEPGSLLLLSTVLGVLGFATRRKSQAA